MIIECPRAHETLYLGQVGTSDTTTSCDPRCRLSLHVVQRHTNRVAQAAKLDVLSKVVDVLQRLRLNEDFSGLRIDYMPELNYH